MRSFIIVEAQPSRQVTSARCAAAIKPTVGPLSKHRLDEPLGLAVGARRIGTGAVMAQRRLHACAPEAVGAIAGAVVCEQRADRNSLQFEPAASTFHKGRAARPLFIGQDLGVSDLGVVVNRDVNKLPAGSIALPEAASRDSMAGTVEAGELLRVEVQKLSCLPTLVTIGRTGRLQARLRSQAVARQHRADSGPSHTKRLGDAPGWLAKLAQVYDHVTPVCGKRVRSASSAAGSISQARLAF